jgi:hypothetical protein
LIAINDPAPATGEIPLVSFEGEGMSAGEELYLLMVIAALALYGGTLAVVSWMERRWAKANGR